VEAVGSAAKTVCPFIDTDEAWHEAVDDVLLQPDLWISKGYERVRELTRRQEKEVWDLIHFLGALV
jgi:Ser/Thr protein kinase RdoA (MazF antagonist)